MCELYKKYMPVTTICREAVDFVIYITYNEEGEPMIETNLAQTVNAANNSGSAYDTNIKYLLADKQILSHILKYTVNEFQDMDIEDILGCIGDDIEVGERPIDAGLSNLGRVKGTITEDNIPGEGIIYYDIRFTAYLREKEMKILINIEAQKSTDFGKLGYHLENRIVFYLARMISAQKQTEFFHSDFDNLKKVRSIWICMDSEETEDSIEEIGFDRKTVFGNKRSSYHTDLMKGIIVNIRSEGDSSSGIAVKKSQNVLIAMLEELVSRKDASEKKRILADEYGMTMTVELERRIQIMCNWSESIREQARMEGRMEGRIEAIEGMLRVNITREQILSMGYTEAEYEKAESVLYANA